MIKVYHKTAYSDDAKWPETFLLVAEVKSDDLDEVFEMTNSIDNPWWENEGVLAKVAPCRSTSVGDVLEFDGHPFRCEVAGWSHLRSNTQWAKPLFKVGDKVRNLVVVFDEYGKAGVGETGVVSSVDLSDNQGWIYGAEFQNCWIFASHLDPKDWVDSNTFILERAEDQPEVGNKVELLLARADHTWDTIVVSAPTDLSSNEGIEEWFTTSGPGNSPEYHDVVLVAVLSFRVTND